MENYSCQRILQQSQQFRVHLKEKVSFDILAFFYPNKQNETHFFGYNSYSGDMLNIIALYMFPFVTWFISRKY